MPWQTSVNIIPLVIAGLLFVAADNFAAGVVLPPLLTDLQQPIDVSQQRPCRYTGDFRQERHIEELDSPLASSGSFMFTCDKGLLWEVREPIVDTRIYSTDSLNFRILKNKDVTALGGIANSRIARLLLDLLGGNTAALAKDFDLASDGKSPAFLVLRPKQRAVQKRLTQLIVQQQDDAVTITIQAPSTGDFVISIDNIALFEDDDLAACKQFSQQPSPNCSVLINPGDFVTTPADSTR